MIDNSRLTGPEYLSILKHQEVLLELLNNLKMEKERKLNVI